MVGLVVKMKKGGDMFSRCFLSCFLAFICLLVSVRNSEANIDIVVSIKPVHSLVAAVMDGIAKPHLLIDGFGTPHSYALKPSDAKRFQRADLIFWIGPSIESFLTKPLAALPKKADVVTLMETRGLKKIMLRTGGAFDDHEHKDRNGKRANTNKQETIRHTGHVHEKYDEHLINDGFDPHIWLDPINAKVLVHHITEWLVISDSQNAVTYLSNSKLLLSELDSLIEQVGAQLTNVKHENYIVFHDAYQHFEARFDIPAAGAITISPNQPPGANRLREIQRKIHNTASICVFAEPQFEPTMVTSLSELLNVRTGIIDPIGASINRGPGLYSKLLLNMAGSIKDCLSTTI